MNVQKMIRSVVMGILSGNPQDEPMHYGEVFGTWTHLLANNGLIAGYQSLPLPPKSEVNLLIPQ
jgi:hypothetical protein